MKTFLKWTIGILIGIVALKLLFWLLKIVLGFVWFVIIAGGLLLGGSFIYKLISKKN